MKVVVHLHFENAIRQFCDQMNEVCLVVKAKASKKAYFVNNGLSN